MDGAIAAAFADRAWGSADGLALHARDYPAAPGPARLPVVCLHGLTRNARDFEDLAPRVAAAGRRVLVPEMRGRGASAWDPVPERYVLAVYAADVAFLCAALGIGRAVFVGTSMGGLITMALAAMQRGLVAAAVINDIGPEIEPEGVARIQAHVGPAPEIASWADAAARVERLNREIFPHYGPADWDRMARRLFREDEAGRPRLDYDPAIAVPLREGVAAGPALWPFWRRLARRRPVLAIRGGRSDLLSARTFRRMGRGSTVRLVEVPGVGHAPMLDEPAARAAIDAFLAEVP